MTVRVRSGIRCQKCGREVVCACGHTVTASTPLSDWLRALRYPLDSSRVSLQNLDYIWHVYQGDNWLITIEEKRFGAHSNFAQQDTHGIVRQMLEAASGTLVRTARKQLKPVEYRGHYEITFEKSGPEDSAWLLINGERGGKDDILALLRTGRLPWLEDTESA